MNNKSFTLIELLVVIVIIGILAGVIMISTSSSIDKASFAKAQTFSNTINSELLLNLVSEWTFDEGAGITGQVATSSDLLDKWGNWPGSVSGNVILRGDGDCFFGKCLQFNGGTEYVVYQTAQSPKHPTNSITISAWIKSNNISSEQTIISRNGPYIIRISGSKMRLALYTTTNWIFQAGQKLLQNNEWYYITLTYDNVSMKGYVNGIIDINGSKTGNFGSYGNLYFGKPVPLGEDYPFNGFLDEVRIHNVALSTSQIKQNYIAGLDYLLSNGTISKKDYDQRINELAYDN